MYVCTIFFLQRTIASTTTAGPPDLMPYAKSRDIPSNGNMEDPEGGEGEKWRTGDDE